MCDSSAFGESAAFGEGAVFADSSVFAEGATVFAESAAVFADSSVFAESAEFVLFDRYNNNKVSKRVKVEPDTVDRDSDAGQI
ncbi:hypothetical protein H4219_006228, partial [Mycoemilia scoparia]